MNAIIETAGRLNDATRAAKNLLAEMGSSRWTPRDQSQFDMHMDAADAAKDRLDALLHASGHANVIRDQAREGLDLFIRKDAKNMSASEVGKVRNTMSTTTASQGGYSVMPLVAGEFVNLLKGYGWVRQVATQRSTAGGADMTFPTSDGAAEIGEQLAQNVTATAADPSFAALPIPVYKFSSKIFTVPLELLQDAQIDMVAFVTQRARDRIGRIQNTKFTTGTGTGEAIGTDATRNLIKEQITGPLSALAGKALGGDVTKGAADSIGAGTLATAQAALTVSTTAATASIGVLAVAAQAAAAAMGTTSVPIALSAANAVGAGGGDALGAFGKALGFWSEGGYTGPGGKYDPAGIVHAGEYVVTAENTKKLGVDFLDRLNSRGYANGGYVGAIAGGNLRQAVGNMAASPVQVVIHNTVGSVATLDDIRKSQRDTEQRIVAGLQRSRTMGGAAA
jgi:HK97 family phage major capsid protein